jgi:glycosyltransferase involved in cell wall biosynthesis
VPPRHPPLISIVTPSFNQGIFLERTLRSVLDQRYPRLEYLVSDGGSRDETPAVLERYRAALHYCRCGPDRGQAHAINLGFRHSQGQILAFLNADDLLLPGSLAYVACYFAGQPEVDVVYGHRVLIDEADGEIGRWVLPPHSDEMLRWRDYVPQETLFWRRRIWQRSGAAVDESFHFALDWELLLRFRAAGARFARLPRFLGAFRVHGGQKTNTVFEDVGRREIERLQRRCHSRAVSEREIDQRLRPYLCRHVICQALYRLGVFCY